jgi:hypothetical protein
MKKINVLYQRLEDHLAVGKLKKIIQLVESHFLISCLRKDLLFLIRYMSGAFSEIGQFIWNQKSSG